MKSIKKKIFSSKGAAVLIALLVLLIVTSVSSVILSAAMLSMNRVEARTDNQQAQLTAHSVMDIVCKDIVSTEDNCGLTCYVQADESAWKMFSSCDEKVPLAKHFNKAVESALNTGVKTEEKVPVAFSGDAGNIENIEVAASVCINPDGKNLPVVFPIPDDIDALDAYFVVGARTPDESYAMKVYLKPVVSAKETTSGIKYMMITWTPTYFTKTDADAVFSEST